MFQLIKGCKHSQMTQILMYMLEEDNIMWLLPNKYIRKFVNKYGLTI